MLTGNYLIVYNYTMSKQTSIELTEESKKILEQYRKYTEEVNLKVGLPMSKTLSLNQLVNGALSLLRVCNNRYNVFSVDQEMQIVV